MSGSGKKWLSGCGIGCGLSLLIAVLGGTYTYNAFKGLETKVQDIEESTTALADQYGDRLSYIPQVDGSVPADRMEVFLSVRESVEARASRLSEILEELESDAGVFKKAKLWIKVVPAAVNYGGELTESMLELGMGVGEYQYIYGLVFFNVLPHDPADGSSFVMNVGDEDSKNSVQFRFNDDDEEKVRAKRSERVRLFFNQGQRAALEHQIDAYRATLSPEEDWTLAPWGAQLYAEKQALELESVRMLWEDALPESIRNSFTPYLDRLSATYYPLINPIELGLSDLD